MSTPQTENQTTQQDEKIVVVTKPKWWRGTRGEWYVIAQEIFGLLVFLGPRTYSGLPAWPSFIVPIASVIGKIFAVVGILLLIAGIITLGKNLTPLPYPKENSELVEKGPYRFVRHPIYSGVIILTLGYALIVHGWLTLLYVALLFIFFDLKARKEEQWLREKFSNYTAYSQRVSRLIPYIY